MSFKMLMAQFTNHTQLLVYPNKRRAILNLIFIALLALQTSPIALAETRKVKIPKASVITAINSYMAGFQLNLDNWGSFRSSGGGTWQTDSSYLLFPSGRKKPLNIPRSKTVKLGGKFSLKRYNAYIDDFSTQSLNVKTDGDKLKVSIFFESAGNEIRIGCINRRKKNPCKAHLMNHKGHINNAHIYGWFKPGFSGTTISLVPVDLTLDFDLKLDSWILQSMKNVASHFYNIKGNIRSTAKQEFMKEFNKAEVRAAMSVNLNKFLSNKLINLVSGRLGQAAGNYVKNNAQITRIQDIGSNYVVTVKYPDIVHSDSVKIVSFAPKSKKLTAGCPFNFGFDATIKTDVKVNGKTWLEIQPGKNGKKFSWQRPKAGKTTSTLSTKISGSPGKKTSKKARLVITWKGTDGKKYKKNSRWKKFKGICSKSQSSFQPSI